jgi:MoaA/NifB/PqqE/SkfB family radical SAM enzyme
MKEEEERYEFKPKRKSLQLAAPLAKAYMDRERRRRKEADQSPLMGREGLTGAGCLHLREEEHGHGLLLVNGSLVVHANPTALLYLKLIFAGEEDSRIVRKVTGQFKVRPSIARQDLADLKADIERLERGEAPVRGTRVEPFSVPTVAPMRVDLALTYRTLENAPATEGARELNADDWIKALDKLWNFGVPHLCITGGEPTLREDLVDIVEHAASLGMMVGVLTSGERLGSHAFLGRLLDAGLAYVQVSVASHDETVHAKVLGTSGQPRSVEGIKNCLREGMPVLANIPITTESEYGLEETVDFLVKLGVTSITVNPLDQDERSMPDWMVSKALERARKAARGRARTFYFGPVPGKAPAPLPPSEAGPVGDLSMADLEWGAGLVSLHVHPDGAITAGRAHATVVGNVLSANWTMVWHHSLLKEVRVRQAEGRKWRPLNELGFNGYPLFPGPKVTCQGPNEA